MLVVLFWACAAGVAYAYAGYPIALWLGCRIAPRAVGLLVPPSGPWPGVSIVLPVYNERDAIHAKLVNTCALSYGGPLEIIVVSDASDDGTDDVVRSVTDPRIRLLRQEARQGKGAALNRALEYAQHEIVVFTDAGISLATEAISALVAPFADPSVGCVSGEDRIVGPSGEGLYGRYELALRRLESRFGSIVGASGSLYAQRRSLCAPFIAGLAPDFLSVLRTADAGYAALSTPDATGTMTATQSSSGEFERKVRTLLRGITTLFAFPQLLNPVRVPKMAFCLASHKLARWSVPFLMLTMFLTSLWLAAGSMVYALILVLQVLFYGVALLGVIAPATSVSRIARVPLFFCLANAAALVAAVKYGRGIRQEVWAPTRRS